jgi:hypothetical protein
MPNEQAILEVAGLIVDGVAVSEALLAGDMEEARFRTRLVVGHARLHGMTEVQAAAVELVRLLGKTGNQPTAGYASAVVELSEALDRALTVLRA